MAQGRLEKLFRPANEGDIKDILITNNEFVYVCDTIKPFIHSNDEFIIVEEYAKPIESEILSSGVCFQFWKNVLKFHKSLRIVKFLESETLTLSVIYMNAPSSTSPTTNPTNDFDQLPDPYKHNFKLFMEYTNMGESNHRHVFLERFVYFCDGIERGNSYRPSIIKNTNNYQFFGHLEMLIEKTSYIKDSILFVIHSKKPVKFLEEGQRNLCIYKTVAKIALNSEAVLFNINILEQVSGKANYSKNIYCCTPYGINIQNYGHYISNPSKAYINSNNDKLLLLHANDNRTLVLDNRETRLTQLAMLAIGGKETLEKIDSKYDNHFTQCEKYLQRLEDFFKDLKETKATAVFEFTIQKCKNNTNENYDDCESIKAFLNQLILNGHLTVNVSKTKWKLHINYILDTVFATLNLKNMQDVLRDNLTNKQILFRSAVAESLAYYLAFGTAKACPNVDLLKYGLAGGTPSVSTLSDGTVQFSPILTQPNMLKEDLDISANLIISTVLIWETKADHLLKNLLQAIVEAVLASTIPTNSLLEKASIILCQETPAKFTSDEGSEEIDNDNDDNLDLDLSIQLPGILNDSMEVAEFDAADTINLCSVDEEAASSVVVKNNSSITTDATSNENDKILFKTFFSCLGRFAYGKAYKEHWKPTKLLLKTTFKAASKDNNKITICEKFIIMSSAIESFVNNPSTSIAKIMLKAFTPSTNEQSCNNFKRMVKECLQGAEIFPKCLLIEECEPHAFCRVATFAATKPEVPGNELHLNDESRNENLPTCSKRNLPDDRMDDLVIKSSKKSTQPTIMSTEQVELLLKFGSENLNDAKGTLRWRDLAATPQFRSIYSPTLSDIFRQKFRRYITGERTKRLCLNVLGDENYARCRTKFEKSN